MLNDPRSFTECFPFDHLIRYRMEDRGYGSSIISLTVS